MTNTILALGLSSILAGCVLGDGANSNSEDIIGGVIDYGDPSIVSIFAHKPGEDLGSLCTGTVISSTAILTAAHCVDPASVGAGRVFEVYTGTVFGKSTPLAVSRVVWNTKFDITHPENGNDVAIVKLATPTTLTPLSYGALGPATKVRIVGFGMNSHLNVSAPYVSSGSGTKRTATTTLNSSDARFLKIGDTGHQTCHGDSGGPALQVVNGREVVVGITSYGTDIDSQVVCFYGGTDTRVDAYLAWIDANK